MEYKIEQGLRATLVVTPVDSVKSEIYDGLSAIKDYLASLPATTPPPGSKENPHDTGAPALKRGYYTLHPRVLNDPELVKSFKDEAKRVFTGEPKLDYITQVWFSGDEPVRGVVKPNGNGQFYVDYRATVKCSGWYGDAVMVIAANDLLQQEARDVHLDWSSIVKAERRLYRNWKDAQLKEAKNLTKKRIMKALAGPEDAPFKFGDRLKGKYSNNKYTFIGYSGAGSVIALDASGYVLTGLIASKLTKEGS